jgi:hypothetical protein
MAPKADKVRVIARPPPRAPRTGWHVLGRRSTIHDFVGLSQLRGSHAPERAAFLAAASSRGSTNRLACASSA